MRGLILLLVAVLLALPLFPIGLIYTFVKTFRNVSQTFIKRLETYLFIIAYSIDQLGNAVMQELFNDTLIHHYGYKFGNPDETISSVLGKNKLQNTLTGAGRILCGILEFIDRKHTEKAIENDETETT